MNKNNDGFDNDGLSDPVGQPQFDGQFDKKAKKLNRYQRLLIPANIVVAVVAVLAIVFQFLMPMLSFKVTVTGEEIAEIVEFVQPESDEGSAGDEGNINVDDIIYITKDVNSNVTVSIDPFGALRLGPAPDAQSVRDYLTAYAIDMNGTIDEIFAQMLPRMTVYLVSSTLQDNLGDIINIDELESIDVEQIQSVTEAITSGNYEEARTQFKDAAVDVATELGHELSDEDIDLIMENYDEAIAAGTHEDGTFSFIDAITTLAEKYGIDLDNLSQYMYYGSGVVATASAADDGEVETDGSGGDSSSEIDPEEFIQSYINKIPDNVAQIIGTSLFVVAAVLIGFTSLMWLIMAIIALIRVFCKDKRFAMWYVKAFCWLPCVLLVICPLVAVALAPGLLAGVVGGSAGEILTIVGNIPMMFGGSGIASGICLLVLWLISIIWLHPIKRKILKIKR